MQKICIPKRVTEVCLLDIFTTFTILSSMVGPISAVESLGENDNDDDSHDDENYSVDVDDKNG